MVDCSHATVDVVSELAAKLRLDDISCISSSEIVDVLNGYFRNVHTNDERRPECYCDFCVIDEHECIIVPSVHVRGRCA